MVSGLSDSCIWVIPIAYPTLDYLSMKADGIEEKLGETHHFSGNLDELKGVLGEYHYENYYCFDEKPVNETPGDGKVDYMARYTPTGVERTISVNTRAEYEPSLLVRDYRLTCDRYFLYETNIHREPDIPLVGLLGYATKEELEKAGKNSGYPRSRGQYPHEIKCEDLHKPPLPHELEPIE